MSTENPSGPLDALRTDLEKEDSSAVLRAKIGIGVRLFLIVFVFGYMTWLMGAVSKLDAQELTRLAAGQVEEQLPIVRGQLRDYAIEIAPGLVDQASDVFVQLPVHLREHVEFTLSTEAEKLIERFEVDAEAAIGQVLDDQLEVVKAAHPDSTPEELLDAIVLGVSDTFSRTITEALDELYFQYAAEIQKLNAHLDYLRLGDDLTASEELDKQLIQAWMVLARQHGLTNAENLLAGLDLDAG